MLPPKINMETSTTHFFLFDNDIFNHLCKSKDSKTIDNFKDCLHTHPLTKIIETYALKLTPFSVLEALGVSIPYPSQITIDHSLFPKIDPDLIATSIFNQAKSYYQNSELFSKTFINNRLDEELTFVNSNARWLYNPCVADVVKESNFLQETLIPLSMDFTMQYAYPEELQAEMNGFFLSQFFAKDEISNSVNKFRIAKRLWNVHYRKEQKGNSKNYDLESINKAMQLKQKKDYLDGDLIHFLCLGAYHEQTNYRVVVFTSNSPSAFKQRISVYKWIINFVKFKFGVDNPSEPIPEIYQNDGLLVYCSSEGEFLDAIDVKSIKPLYRKNEI